MNTQSLQPVAGTPRKLPNFVGRFLLEDTGCANLYKVAERQYRVGIVKPYGCGEVTHVSEIMTPEQIQFVRSDYHTSKRRINVYTTK